METDGGTGQEKCSMNGPRRGRYGNGGGGRYLRRARTPGFGTAQTKRKSEGKPFLYYLEPENVSGVVPKL